MKSLGATLDDKLKLSKQVSNLSRSCFYQIRQLRHIRRYLDFQSAATAVHSFVTSRVDYYNGLLAAGPVKQMDQLLSHQRNFPLTVSFSSLRLQNTRESQINLLHWLRMPERVTFKLCTSVNYCLHGMAPTTSTSCALHCALTPIEVICDWRTKRS